MAKVFTIYKYRDSGVRQLPGNSSTIVRNYVDLVQDYLVGHAHIDKGEHDYEDLSYLSEDRIEDLLYDRIYDSTVTIILISKNMKEDRPDKDQWIPREISYSLSEHSRGGRISHTNAMLAIVLPDENSSYEYFIKPVGCTHCGSIRWKEDTLFEILGKNMFNRKKPNMGICQSTVCGEKYHMGDDHSYIYPVKWDDFKNHVNSYINIAQRIKENMDEYEIIKQISDI